MNRMPPTRTNNPPTKGAGRLTQRKPRKSKYFYDHKTVTRMI
jgi:hypothetical protein